MGMKFTRSGESSHWSWWMGRRAEGAAKVYIRRERGSRCCEIHSKQIPTEEQGRKGLSLFFIFLNKHKQKSHFGSSGSFIKSHQQRGVIKKTGAVWYFPFTFFPGTHGLLSASLCWTIWIWIRKILSTPNSRTAAVPRWWKTLSGRITRRCTSMENGEYLPSSATVSFSTTDHLHAWKW